MLEFIRQTWCSQSQHLSSVIAWRRLQAPAGRRRQARDGEQHAFQEPEQMNAPLNSAHSLKLLWPSCVADADIIFLTCGFFFLSIFYLFSSPNLSRHYNGWDRFGSFGHSCKFQWVSRLGSVTERHCSSGRQRQPNFAALSRGRHLYSARRP